MAPTLVAWCHMGWATLWEADWGVQQMGRVSEEMLRVVQVQAEAFHVHVMPFIDFFYDSFKVSIIVFKTIGRCVALYPLPTF
jgi:hypothetical protein